MLRLVGKDFYVGGGGGGEKIRGWKREVGAIWVNYKISDSFRMRSFFG